MFATGNGARPKPDVEAGAETPSKKSKGRAAGRSEAADAASSSSSSATPPSSASAMAASEVVSRISTTFDKMDAVLTSFNSARAGAGETARLQEINLKAQLLMMSSSRSKVCQEALDKLIEEQVAADILKSTNLQSGKRESAE